MSALAVSSILFVCVFIGALLGMGLRSALPEHHLDDRSKDVVRVAMGLVATMAALVLSLLVASAKSAYDEQENGLEQMSASIVILDATLEQFGPEARNARDVLRNGVARAIARIWPEEASPVPTTAPITKAITKNEGRGIFGAIQELSPQNDQQRDLKSRALQIAIDLGRTRWLLAAQEQSSPISTAVLVILAFWLIVLFTSFGLFAPLNPTVVAALLLCSLSVSGAIFLILELAQPFDGFIQVSSAPLRSALANLGP